MKMQLMLVDDEPMILKSMVQNDWASAGVEHVYPAASGLEAAELLKHHPVDIVVTDIRMPGMDGLALCKHVQEHYPRTRCVLLSGFGEFEYARQAIEHRTVGYLLKPVKDDELLAEVKRVAAGIRREWEQIASHERARRTLHLHMPMLRSGFLNDLLSGQLPETGALAERLKEYQVLFQAGDSVLLVMVRPEKAFGSGEEPDALLFEYAVRNIAAEILEPDCDVWHSRDAYGYLVFALRSRKQPQEMGEMDVKALHTQAHELQLKVSGLLKGQVSLLLSEPLQFPRELAQVYRKLLNEFRKIPRSEQEFLALAGSNRTVDRTLTSLYAPPAFLRLMEGGRWDEVRSKLAAIVREMEEKLLDSEEHLAELYHTLVSAFLAIAHQQGKTLMEATAGKGELGESARIMRSAGTIADWAEGILSCLAQSENAEYNDHKRQLLARIHRFIEENLARDVSLQSIADHVKLHAVYLSSMYKQETGENLSDYIMRYRMEQAAVLLRSTEFRIYELAARLGFQNPPYFSKLFKNYYGITPQEYRERLL